MKTFWRFVTSIVFAVLAGAVPGYTQTGSDVFVIAPVAVDVTAESAHVARSQALANGQVMAWERLIARLTLPEDSARLEPVDAEDLTTLVQGYEVLRERTSAVRYLADLSISFDDHAVRRWLSTAGVRFAETPSRPVLVVPILIGTENAVLWEDPNGWRDVWQNLPDRDGLVPVVVPYGDLADIRDLTTLQALQGDKASLYAVARRYGADRVVVAEATWYRNRQDNRPVVELLARPIVSESVADPPIYVLKGQNVDELDRLFADGVKRMVADLTASWKRANLVDPAVEVRVTARVPIAGFGYWLLIRERLSEVGILRRAELLRLSRREALMNLWINGDVAQLRNALQQQELALHDGREEYVLTTRDQLPPTDDLPEGNRSRLPSVSPAVIQ